MVLASFDCLSENLHFYWYLNCTDYVDENEDWEVGGWNSMISIVHWYHLLYILIMVEWDLFITGFWRPAVLDVFASFLR